MGKDRDVEMDDVEKELRDAASKKPFIHRPEQLDIGKGALCWMDGARLCGPDCVAFNPQEGLDPSGVPVDSPNKCLVLTYMGQQGSAALSIISVNTMVRKRMQDEKRPGPGDVPPPPVGGKQG